MLPWCKIQALSLDSRTCACSPTRPSIALGRMPMTRMRPSAEPISTVSASNATIASTELGWPACIQQRHLIPFCWEDMSTCHSLNAMSRVPLCTLPFTSVTYF